MTSILGSKDFFYDFINWTTLVALGMVVLGSFYMVGTSEVAAASRSLANPQLAETIAKDRINYRSKQLSQGAYLIIAGIINFIISFIINYLKTI